MSECNITDLEGWITENYGVCNSEMLDFFEPYRELIVRRIAYYLDDEDPCSWRDYFNTVFDDIPDYVKPIKAVTEKTTEEQDCE